MCTYCMMADWTFTHDPPWKNIPGNPWHANIPAPITSIPNHPWGIDRLQEFEELLKRIKAIEDKLGCECTEPDKPDYIKLVEDRIAQLEKRVEQNQPA